MILQFNVKTDGKQKLSNNFKVSEFACKDGSEIVLIDEELVQILQILRNYYRKPVNITSGFRTISHNAKVGGASSSQHILGTAADFYIDGITPTAIGEFLERICGNSYGIGIYAGYVHIDTRADKARWKG